MLSAIDDTNHLIEARNDALAREMASEGSSHLVAEAMQLSMAGALDWYLDADERGDAHVDSDECAGVYAIDGEIEVISECDETGDVLGLTVDGDAIYVRETDSGCRAIVIASGE
jgi:hypothetical protein